MEHELIDSIKPLPDIPIKIVNAMVLGDCVDVPGKTGRGEHRGYDPECPRLRDAGGA